jgi:hypothetical protein
VKTRVSGGKTRVNRVPVAAARSYGRDMRTRDDILLPEDAWGADRLAWEDDEEPGDDREDDESPPEDPRY